MEEAVKALFETYAKSFNRALHGSDPNEIVEAFAPEFIGASPKGIMTGKSDGLKPALEKGFARYRAIGNKEMRLRNVRIMPVDELHCLARVSWTAVYERKGASDVTIDFDVHYLIRMNGGQPRIFGWIAGDEEAELRKHGIG